MLVVSGNVQSHTYKIKILVMGERPFLISFFQMGLIYGCNGMPRTSFFVIFVVGFFVSFCYYL